uniref:DUF3535 domain-containing protein n=1 Tax=Schistocephalus solidus TaxID=70667 RepID=A0A183TLB4_SCHSO
LLPPPPQPPPPSPPPPPQPSAMGSLSYTVLNATAYSPHASAWLVTCESIARRLVNQCLGLRRHPPSLYRFLLPTLRPQLQLTHRLVTCESIARRLVNQCLGLRHTVSALASTALAAPSHLHTAWAY